MTLGNGSNIQSAAVAMDTSGDSHYFMVFLMFSFFPFFECFMLGKHFL